MAPGLAVAFGTMASSSRTFGAFGGVLLLTLGLVVAARSCGTPDPGLTGVWRGTGVVPSGAEDPVLARAVASLSLTLKGDGTFRLVDGGIPISGRWRRRDDALLIDVEALMDRPLAAQPTASRTAAGALTARIDGATIVFRGLSGAEVRLRREAPTNSASQPTD